jgi:hypothetical protein
MSSRKRVSREPTSSPDPKRVRTILTADEKSEIYEFYQTFCNRTSSPRKQKKPKKHNDVSLAESWRCKPSKFKTVSLTAWKKIISKGKAGEVWRRSGRPRTLNEDEEKSLADHIKQVATQGHLVTNNAIVYWALQTLSQSPRFPPPKEDDSEEVKQQLLESKIKAVCKFGGEKWLKAFKDRHGIVLNKNSKGLEAIRAKKTQPENYVEFYKKTNQDSWDGANS